MIEFALALGRKSVLALRENNVDNFKWSAIVRVHDHFDKVLYHPAGGKSVIVDIQGSTVFPNDQITVDFSRAPR